MEHQITANWRPKVGAGAAVRLGEQVPGSLGLPTGSAPIHIYQNVWGGFEDNFIAPPTEAQSTLTLYMAQQELLRSLQRQIEAIGNEIVTLKEMLQDRPLVSSSQLYDLDDDSLLVGVPIPVTLEETNDEAFAQWPEMGVSGLGPTLSEAISALKSEVAELYRDLVSRDAETLGPPAAHYLHVLRAHIAPR